MEPVEQPVDRMIVAERVLDYREMHRPDGVADETLAKGFGRSDDAAGQGKIESGPTEQARKEIRAADIGQEADADLRHAEAVALAGDAMGSVKRNADAAAEHEPVDQGHIRSDEFLEQPDMAVGGAIEFTDRALRGLLGPLMQHFEIAAARENGRVRRLHHDPVNE